MFPSAANISRPEISAFLEEASGDPGLIAQRVLPVYTVASRAGRYPKFRIAKGGLLRAESTRRGVTGTYNETTRQFEWDTYDCQDYGLTERVDDVLQREMSSFFDAEVITGKQVKGELELDYESRVAGLVFNSASFNTTAALVDYTGTNNTAGTIRFPDDVNNALTRLRLKRYTANTMIMNRNVWNVLRASVKLQNYLYGNIGAGTQFRVITPKDIGDVFGIPNVLIADASIDATPKGTSSSAVLAALSFVWSNSYVWIGNVQGGEFSSGGAGRTITWGADVPGGLFVSETYREESRRGNIIRVRMNVSEKISDLNAGELISTNYSAS